MNKLTLTLELDLDRVKMNQHAKYRRLLSEHTDTHNRPIALIGSLKCSIKLHRYDTDEL